jgi:ribosome maturation factor RimP
MDKNRIQELLSEALAENESLFLVDLSFLSDTKIQIVVDGDSGVPLNECIRISRAIEHSFEKEEVDFALEVTTPDIAEPLRLKRQYRKNLNRILKVKTNDALFEGTLIEVNEAQIVLAWKAREPKPIGKGKVTVEKKATLTFQEIKEAKVKIIF